jgi:hypothetical protein
MKLIAYVEPERLHELHEPGGYFSHDCEPEKVATLCREFALRYGPEFVSIAALADDDDVHQSDQQTSKAYGIPLLLKTGAVLPHLRIACSDDIHNVAVEQRGDSVALFDLSSSSDSEKVQRLERAVSMRSNADYAEARMYSGLSWDAHVERLLSPEENDPLTQAGLWSDEEEQEIQMQVVTTILNGREYSGAYEVRGEIITVFLGHAKKSTQLGGHKNNPDTLAAILLRELAEAEERATR